MKSMPATELKVIEEAPPVSPSVLKRLGMKTWQFWLGVVISLAFLVLALRAIDLAETVNALRRVNVWILCMAVASYVFSVVAKSARWRLLLSVHKAPTYSRAFSIFSIGQMMNSFLPAHLGEFARAYLMGEAEADSKVYVLGTIAVERMADLFFLLISLILLLSQMVLPDWLASPARVTALIVAVLLPTFVLLVWQKNFVLRMVEWVSHLVPSTWREWLLRQANFGLAGLDALRRPRLLGGLIGWSLIVCLLSTLTNYLVFLALGLALPLWAALLLLVVLQVGTEIPSSAGGVGVFQYVIILTLSFLAVDKNVALVYSILLYLVVSVPIVAIGLYSLWREKISWQNLDEAAAMLKRLKNRSK